MICPNCGAEIPDDKLLCENCGAELAIVTDFDLEIEKEMQETLQNIKETEFPEEFDMEFDEDPNIISMIAKGAVFGKVFYVILALAFVAFLVGAITIGKKLSARNSYEYQIELANAKVSENDLLGAIGALETAYTMKPDAETLFQIADYYYTLNRENDAIYTLMEVATGEFKATDCEKAYKKVISLYINAKSYDKIAEILANCTNPVVLSAYEDYRVFTPEANYEPGTYEEALTLKLSSEGPGSIHYTLDKSDANANSNVYSTPIFLEMGSYNVSAVYVNPYGVCSEPISLKYLIDVEFVFEPTILTESGDYTEATLIEAEVPVLYTLYYTTDGTDPDKNSKRYVSPIPMTEGTTTYKFVSYAPDGTQSTIVERTYKLTISVTYSPADAVIHLGDVLMQKGILIDNQPKKPGYPGEFLYYYSAIYPIVDRGTYYFVVEYYKDEAGNISNTNNVYAINVNDLSTYKVTTSTTGDYLLVDF